MSSRRPQKRRSENREERIVIGLHAINELIRIRPESVSRLLIREDWKTSKDHQSLIELAKKHKISTDTRPMQSLERLAPNQQGVVAYSSELPDTEFEDLAALPKAIVLYLDGITDPHNLGAVLRTSWLMGVSAIVIPSDRSVGITPAVHKVACGGVEHVPVLKVTNFTQSLELLKNAGYWIYGLDHPAKQSIYQLKLPEKVVWILGAEEKGLRQTTHQLCDDIAFIPQTDNAASYNASVAMGIVLGETYRQQHHLQRTTS